MLSPEPVPGSSRESLGVSAVRHAEVDILRGAALFGVLMVNLLISFRVPLLQHLADFHTHPGRLNQLVDLLLGIFVEEKAIIIFSTLFGVSMTIQWERCQARGESYVRLGARRLLALAALGIFHLVFIWNGDILAEYALAGLLILPTLWLPPRGVLGLAVALLVLPVLPLRLPLPRLDWELLHDHVATATRIYSSASYGELWAFRQHETRYVIIPLLGQILPRTMGLMLLGQYLWRADILRRPTRHRSGLRWVARLAIPLAVLVNLGQVVAAYAQRSLGAFTGLLDALSSIPLALGYAAALLLGLQRPALQRIFAPLSAVGRMALSCYLCQSLVLGFVFYSYGLGLFGRFGSAVTAPLGVLLYGAQLMGSHLWLQRYQLGPVEWLWRAVTYGRFPKLRRAAHLASTPGQGPDAPG